MPNGKEKVTKDKVAETLKNLFGSNLGKLSEEAEDPHTIVKHAGQHNLKRLIEDYAAVALTGHQQSNLWFNRIFADTHTHIESLRSRELGMLDDLTTHRKNVDSRTVLHVPTHDFAFSRIWTFIDELVASLTAKTGLQQDVVADLLVKVLADAIAPAIEKAGAAKAAPAAAA